MNVARQPQREELVGNWENAEGRLLLRDDDCFRWSLTTGEEQYGQWTFRGNILLTPETHTEDEPQTFVYQILEFDLDTLTLRWVTTQDHVLPFILRRITATD